MLIFLRLSQINFVTLRPILHLAMTSYVVLGAEIKTGVRQLDRKAATGPIRDSGQRPYGVALSVTNWK